MRVHYLQHVPFEGIGAIGEWAALRGHVLTGTELFRRPVAAPPRQARRATRGRSRPSRPPGGHGRPHEHLRGSGVSLAGGRKGLHRGGDRRRQVGSRHMPRSPAPRRRARRHRLERAPARDRLVSGGIDPGGARASRCSPASRTGSPRSTGTATPSPSPRELRTWLRRRPARTRPSPTTVAGSWDCSSTWRRRTNRSPS